MPAFLSEPQRWVIPAVLIVSVVGGAVSLWWERRRPTSYTRVGSSAAVRVGVQGVRGVDDRALDSQEVAEQGRVRSQKEWRAWQPDTVAGASEAAQVACERMAQINAEFHP